MTFLPANTKNRAFFRLTAQEALGERLNGSRPGSRIGQQIAATAGMAGNPEKSGAYLPRRNALLGQQAGQFRIALRSFGPGLAQTDHRWLVVGKEGQRVTGEMFLSLGQREERRLQFELVAADRRDTASRHLRLAGIVGEEHRRQTAVALQAGIAENQPAVGVFIHQAQRQGTDRGMNDAHDLLFRFFDMACWQRKGRGEA